MLDINSAEYYRKREQQERQIARRCVDPNIAAIHREMAEGYASLLSNAEMQARSFANRDKSVELRP